METLTEDLLTEILLRLSVTDVMRLKSVCKSWNSLIKSPSFISKYNNNWDDNNDDDDDDEPFIVIVNCDGTLILSSYSDLLEHHRSHQNQPQNPTTTYRNLNFQWVCCCDGGLMLGGVGSFVCDPTPKIMWNPATVETKVLPNYPREFVDYNDLEISGLLKEVRGIGFDSKENEYKPFFARIVYSRNMASMDIDIYSFKKNRWRKLVVYQKEEIMFDLAGIFGWGAERVVYANGIPHWMVFNHASQSFMIFSFDMTNEEVTLIPFPDEIASIPAGDGNIIYSMGSCPYHLLFNESLALVSHLRGEDDNGNLINYSNCSYEIWVLAGYGVKASWSKVVTVPPLPLALQGNIGTRFVGFLNHTNIFVLRVDEEEDDMELRYCRCLRNGKLLLYDTVTRQALDLHISGASTMVMTCPKTLFPIVSQ